MKYNYQNWFSIEQLYDNYKNILSKNISVLSKKNSFLHLLLKIKNYQIIISLKTFKNHETYFKFGLKFTFSYCNS